MNVHMESRIVRKWLIERVERTSARSVADELGIDRPTLIAELYSHGEMRAGVLEPTTRWLRENGICLPVADTGDKWGTEPRCTRLMVVLDLQSLEVPPHCIGQLDEAVMEVVEERLGSVWVREIYRLYPKASEKREIVERVGRLKVEGKVRKWRFPRHRGRKPPADWDKRINDDAAEWCVRDPSAVSEESVMVLVSNGGKFDRLVQELEAAGVELLLVTVGADATALDEIYGSDRTLRVWQPENDSWLRENDGGEERDNESSGDSGRAVDSRVENVGIGAESSA